MGCCKNVESYVPGAEFYKGKEEEILPAFAEDFAMLTADLKILSARGSCFSVGKSFPDVCSLPASEVDFLRRNCRDGVPILLANGKELFLILTGCFADTGLLGAVRPWKAGGALREILQVLQISCRISEGALALPKIGGHQAEILMESAERAEAFLSAFSLKPEVDMARQAGIVARLCGCKIELQNLRASAVELPPKTKSLWTVFLFCLFLTLRGTTGKGVSLSLVSASGETVSVFSDQPKPPQKRMEGFDFLKAPCFADFRLCLKENRLGVEAVLPLRQPAGVIRAIGLERCRLELAFELKIQSVS